MNTSDLDAQLAAGDITQAQYNTAVQAQPRLAEDNVQLGYYDSVIELFELDLRNMAAVDTASQERYYFTNQVLPDGSKIKWRRSDNRQQHKHCYHEPLTNCGYEF